MFLYLVRHGDAKKETDDPLRPLSQKGLHDITRIAAYISSLNLRVSSIFHSRKLRARQTAETLFEYLKPSKGLLEADGLAPLDHPDIWMVRIRDMQDDIMLVGHLPHLGRLASLLLFGKSDQHIFDLRTSGVVCLQRNMEEIWSVEWMLTPEIVIGERR